MDKEITIKVDEILVAKNKAGELALSQDAEKELRKIIDLKLLVDNIYGFVGEVLKTQLLTHNLKKIVSGAIVVSQRPTGEKYSIENKNDAAFFLKTITRIVVDSEKVDEYRKAKGELPAGIIENARPISVQMKLRDE